VIIQKSKEFCCEQPLETVRGDFYFLYKSVSLPYFKEISSDINSFEAFS